jgi:FCP1-like phosphatase family protein
METLKNQTNRTHKIMSADCPHPETFDSLCVVCGALIESTRSTTFTTTASNNSTDLLLSSSRTTISATRSILVNGNVLTVNEDTAAMKLASLQRTRRLVLVLDIDHTLLHSVQIDGPPPRGAAAIMRDGEIHHLPIEEFDQFGRIKHLVMKKRPYLDHFLAEAHKFCRMSIYTAGKRAYAEAVVKILDPEGKYFQKRIIARCDGTLASNTTGHRGRRVVGGGGDSSAEKVHKALDNVFVDQESSLAVILDDREDVWKGKQQEQLLLVRAYEYFFPNSPSVLEVMSGMSGMSGLMNSSAGMMAACQISEANNAPGSSLTVNLTLAQPSQSSHQGGQDGGSSSQQQGGQSAPVIRLHGRPGEVVKHAPVFTREYTEEDDQLLRALEVLRSLHSTYYDELDQQQPNRDSASSMPPSLHIVNHVKRMKSEILQGYTLTFSGLIPTNYPGGCTAHPLWALAVSLGAFVTMDLSPRTTHLVTTQTNTKKVYDCRQGVRRKTVWIVSPLWLSYCRWAMTHVAEQAFMLFPSSVSGQKGERVDEELPNPVRCFDPLNDVVGVDESLTREVKKRERSEVSMAESETDREIEREIEKESERVKDEVHSDDPVAKRRAIEEVQDDMVDVYDTADKLNDEGACDNLDDMQGYDL